MFLDHVPLFNKFRDTKMMLVLVQLIVPLGAAMALHEMMQPEAAKRWKRWALGGSATAVLMLAFYAMPKVWFDFASTIRPDVAMEQLGKRVVGMRIDVFREDVLRSFGYAAVGLMFTLALVKRWTQARYIVLGAVFVTAVDLLSVDGRYLSDANYISQLDKRFPFEATAADRAILAQERQRIADFDTQWESAKGRWEDRLDAKLTRRYNRVIDAAAFEVLNANSHYRVFDLANPFNDARTSYFHKSVGGYHGAKLRRYQEFIERVLTPERAAVIQSIQSGNFNLTADVGSGAGHAQHEVPPGPRGGAALALQWRVGPAWFVDEVQWVNTAEEEIGAIAGFGPRPHRGGASVV